jgi:SAM-dependent methyltransferase
MRIGHGAAARCRFEARDIARTKRWPDLSHGLDSIIQQGETEMEAEQSAQPWIASEAGCEVRKHAPATLRNRDAITEILAGRLPAEGLVLEIASGSGEHVVHFASCFPKLQWQPSDPDPHALASIEAWGQDIPTENLMPPLRIDAAADRWAIGTADAVLCINMSHIAPWEATLGLIAGARRVLPPGGPLILYGPFTQADVATAPSNVAFDLSLRERDEKWGLRAAEDVIKACREHGFGPAELLPMPANNLALIFRVI